jgi:hypothetical protein
LGDIYLSLVWMSCGRIWFRWPWFSIFSSISLWAGGGFTDCLLLW